MFSPEGIEAWKKLFTAVGGIFKELFRPLEKVVTDLYETVKSSFISVLRFLRINIGGATETGGLYVGDKGGKALMDSASLKSFSESQGFSSTDYQKEGFSKLVKELGDLEFETADGTSKIEVGDMTRSSTQTSTAGKTVVAEIPISLKEALQIYRKNLKLVKVKGLEY